MSDLLPERMNGSRGIGRPVPHVNGHAEPAAAAGQNQRVLKFFLRYWWVPVLSTGIALAGAVAFLWFTPATFVSTGRLWETEKMRLPADNGGFTEDLQDYLGTQAEVLRSDKLKRLALQRLRARGDEIPLDRHGKPLKIRLRIAQAPKTAVLQADAFSASPKFAQAFLDSLMQEYLEYKKTVRKSVSGDTLASVSEQALRLERELKASQEALTGFERSNNLAILEEEGRVAGEHLTRLKTQLSDLKLQAQLLEATASEAALAGLPTTNVSSLFLNPVPGLSLNLSAGFTPERQAALKDVEILRLQREKLSKYLRPKHPKMVKLEADLERAQKVLDMYRSQTQEQLDASRQALKMSSETVAGSINEWESKVVEANQRIAEAERLKLNVSRTQTLYDRLTLLLQNVDVNRSIDRETLAILEPASAAERYYLRDFMILAVAAVVGFCAGIGLVFILEVRDDRFSSVLEVDEKFGDSVVGQLPEIPGLVRSGPIALVENGEQQEMFAESCRSLRSALLYLPCEGQRPKSILVTSALPDEGKSTVAANLARSLALGGARVLLVDADLRKGTLHKVLGLESAPGLADLIAEGTSPEEVIQTDSTPNLSFIARGAPPTNPGDLLMKPLVGRLLGGWREKFDFVVIDSCPVFAADDVTTLAHKVDGTLFVVRRRFSRGVVVREALEMLLQRQAKVLGLVFNRADASSKSYHYYSYKQYHTSS